MLPLIPTYDPVGASSGSLDPLGSMQGYLALANLLVPGLTTITTRSRYFSMLCAALASAENHRAFPPGPSGLRERRRSVLPFERLWALACVAASPDERSDTTKGLRGYRYVIRTYRSVSRSKSVTPDFPMLRSQERTGAIGTYWNALVAGDLVDPDEGRLTAEGSRLAEAFPLPPLTARELTRLAEPDNAHRVRLPVEAFDRWAQRCHLSAAGSVEKERLRNVLTSDDRRECLARALKEYGKREPLPSRWTLTHLAGLRGALAEADRNGRLRLVEAVEAIGVYERFHEAALALFESMLWWATTEVARPVREMAISPFFRSGVERARVAAEALLGRRSLEADPAIRAALDGLAPFASALRETRDESEAAEAIMARHRRVQSGKVDGGVPKREWISRGGDRILRPAPAHQRIEPPQPAAGERTTHPYRLEQFVGMLRENGALPRATLA